MPEELHPRGRMICGPDRRSVRLRTAVFLKVPGSSMPMLKRRKSDNQVTGDFCQRFGTIAVRKGFVTPEEVKRAIIEQLDDNISGREHRLLGSILFGNGLITEVQIEAVLQELKKTIK
jgi:hypothetical protein